MLSPAIGTAATHPCPADDDNAGKPCTTKGTYADSFSPGLTAAEQAAQNVASVTVDVTNITGVKNIITQVVGVMQTILFAVAAIFVVIAGYQYLTAQGDPEKTANARNVLIYAIIAVGIGILATILKTLVISFLRAG